MDEIGIPTDREVKLNWGCLKKGIKLYLYQGQTNIIIQTIFSDLLHGLLLLKTVNCIFKAVGSAIIKDSNLYKYSNSFSTFQNQKFDAEHKKICEKIIKSSENYKISGKFTHGIAAKLLNCYQINISHSISI